MLPQRAEHKEFPMELIRSFITGSSRKTTYSYHDNYHDNRHYNYHDNHHDNHHDNCHNHERYRHLCNQEEIKQE